MTITNLLFWFGRRKFWGPYLTKFRSLGTAALFYFHWAAVLYHCVVMRIVACINHTADGESELGLLWWFWFRFIQIIFSSVEACFTAHELNWTVAGRPSYTTRSFVVHVSATTWLAAAKLGQLVLGQFVHCECNWNAFRTWVQYSWCAMNISWVSQSQFVVVFVI